VNHHAQLESFAWLNGRKVFVYNSPCKSNSYTLRGNFKKKLGVLKTSH
jgi:hypothetical protein